MGLICCFIGVAKSEVSEEDWQEVAPFGVGDKEERTVCTTVCRKKCHPESRRSHHRQGCLKHIADATRKIKAYVHAEHFLAHDKQKAAVRETKLCAHNSKRRCTVATHVAKTAASREHHGKAVIRGAKEQLRKASNKCAKQSIKDGSRRRPSDREKAIKGQGKAE